MRKRGRVDGNQPAIVAALREMGASVAILSNVGDGVPDIAVGAYGQTCLVEIKAGSAKLTDDELDFHQHWKGWMEILRHEDDVPGLMFEMRRRAAKC